MEELKKDVESAKILSAHKSFLENVQDLGILKKKNIVTPEEPMEKQTLILKSCFVQKKVVIKIPLMDVFQKHLHRCKHKATMDTIDLSQRFFLR